MLRSARIAAFAGHKDVQPCFRFQITYQIAAKARKNKKPESFDPGSEYVAPNFNMTLETALTTFSTHFLAAGGGATLLHVITRKGITFNFGKNGHAQRIAKA